MATWPTPPPPPRLSPRCSRPSPPPLALLIALNHGPRLPRSRPALARRHRGHHAAARPRSTTSSIRNLQAGRSRLSRRTPTSTPTSATPTSRRCGRPATPASTTRARAAAAPRAQLDPQQRRGADRAGRALALAPRLRRRPALRAAVARLGARSSSPTACSSTRWSSSAATTRRARGCSEMVDLQADPRVATRASPTSASCTATCAGAVQAMRLARQRRRRRGRRTSPTCRRCSATSSSTAAGSAPRAARTARRCTASPATAPPQAGLARVDAARRRAGAGASAATARLVDAAAAARARGRPRRDRAGRRPDRRRAPRPRPGRRRAAAAAGRAA